MEWIVIIVAVAVGIWASTAFQRITVHDYQRGLLYTAGKYVKTLEAGRYTIYTPSTSIQIFDMRPTYLTVPGQEIMTKDNIGVKISLTCCYELKDVRKAQEASVGYYGALYSALQVALREVAATQALDQLMESRDAVGPAVLEKAKEAATGLGVTLLKVELLDFMLNANLKRAYAAIKETQKEAERNLEKARGEAAVLRNLANSAKMLENNPQLVQLRLLHTLSETNGNTIVFSADNDTTPLAATQKKKTPAKKKKS